MAGSLEGYNFLESTFHFQYGVCDVLNSENTACIVYGLYIQYFHEALLFPCSIQKRCEGARSGAVPPYRSYTKGTADPTYAT